MPWNRQKKPLEKESLNNNTVNEKVLKIREEMVHIFEDLKHDPHNPELLDRFHKKCLEFNELLKKLNRQYENVHNDLGIFRTKY